MTKLGSEFDLIELVCEACSDNPIADTKPCSDCDGTGRQYVYTETVIFSCDEPNSSEIW